MGLDIELALRQLFDENEELRYRRKRRYIFPTIVYLQHGEIKTITGETNIGGFYWFKENETSNAVIIGKHLTLDKDFFFDVVSLDRLLTWEPRKVQHPDIGYKARRKSGETMNIAHDRFLDGE